MKILLIMPDAGIHRLKLGAISISFREAPLTLTTLAALVPAELDAHITLIDESVQSIPFERHYDLVGISCLTGTALRAYDIADYFRKRGSCVVLGGIHVTLRPDEALPHADAVVSGFAEDTWPELLLDFSCGKLKKTYDDPSPNLKGLPTPRRDLQRRMGYMAPNTVFATRGCKRSCEFCTVAAVPFGWKTRPVEDVIQEIRMLPGRRFAFNDVSIAEDREYARELFTALIPLKKKWGGLVTMDVTEDPELIALMKRSGCVYLLTGIESVSSDSLSCISKSFNRVNTYKNAIDTFHDNGIIVQGCFVFGLDHDDGTIFEETVQAVNQLKIDIPRYAIYTPYPGTRAFERLKEEGRILHQYWPHYDTQHVVLQPARMSAATLEAGFKWAYQQTFALRSIAKRTFGSDHFLIAGIGNLAYRLYLRRLLSEHRRVHADQIPGVAACHT